jgi:hypothetical protein
MTTLESVKAQVATSLSCPSFSSFSQIVDVISLLSATTTRRPYITSSDRDLILRTLQAQDSIVRSQQAVIDAQAAIIAEQANAITQLRDSHRSLEEKDTLQNQIDAQAQEYLQKGPPNVLDNLRYQAIDESFELSPTPGAPKANPYYLTERIEEAGEKGGQLYGHSGCYNSSLLLVGLLRDERLFDDPAFNPGLDIEDDGCVRFCWPKQRVYCDIEDDLTIILDRITPDYNHEKIEFPSGEYQMTDVAQALIKLLRGN